MVVLGIDPGYAIIGYGVISYNNSKFTPVSFGSIITASDMDFNKRLSVIYDDTVSVIRRTKPDAVAIERLYFQTNAKTAIMVAEARGVILLAATKLGVPVYEYTPLQVKVAVTGYGKAHKPQVMEVTRRLLHLKETPKPDDTADALAIAITHIHSVGSDTRRFLIEKGIG